VSLPILTSAACRPYTPRVSAFTARFWTGLSDGHFLTTHCEECGHITFPPKAHCPACWAMRPVWFELLGTGRLYSYTINHVAPRKLRDQAPYAVGIVDFDEGVRVFCRFLDEPTMSDIGGAVQMVAVIHADGPLFAARLMSRFSQSENLLADVR
jgi:uncharacterized protein